MSPGTRAARIERLASYPARAGGGRLRRLIRPALLLGVRRLALFCAVAAFGHALLPGAEAQTARPGQPSYIQEDSIRVVYWGDRRASAEGVLAAALTPFPLPGIAAEYRLSASTIFLAPDRATFDSLAATRTPDWAAGVAIPAQRIIIIPATPERTSVGSAVVTLRHEIVHLVLNGYLGENIPRWFDEGYATWVSGGWDQASGWQIRLALARGHAPPLDSLSLSWPRDQARARLAYLLSASAVAHLANSRGLVAFEAFLAEWRETGDMETAMRAVYQLQPEIFEREWRSMVQRRYGWLLAISQVSVFWGVIAGLVFLLGIARRRRNRERLDALRREEYMLPAVTGEGLGDEDEEEAREAGPGVF